MHRWRQQFSDLFFNPLVIDIVVIDDLPRNDIIIHIDNVFKHDENNLAMKQTNSSMTLVLNGKLVEPFESWK